MERPKNIAALFLVAILCGCGIKEEARKGGTLSLLQDLEKAVRSYHNDWSTYPPTGNINLVSALKQKSPKGSVYYDFKPKMLNTQGEILDGWLRPLVYKKEGQAWRVYSLGSNEVDDGGEGDDLVVSFR